MIKMIQLRYMNTYMLSPIHMLG